MTTPIKKLMLAMVAALAICLGARAASTHDKVQLWKDGPYWATTNIGADEPWDYGYYFWWGDTVGYTNTGSAWISVKDGTEIKFSSSDSTAASTDGKTNSELQDAGYIDATGNLVASHDAAHVHWGGAWRMPTADEIDALTNNCTSTWTTTNGVYGRLVTGKGDYANKSIFLPATGVGSGSSLAQTGSYGYGNYWSSTPDSRWSRSYAWNLHFYYNESSKVSRDYYSRSSGQSVRPVWQPVTVDLSTLTANYTARDGDVLTGSTAYGVIIPGGATVTINGVEVAGAGGGGSVPAPVFAEGGASEIVKFAQAEGGKWTITAFAELGNASIGEEVTSGQVKVYAADTVDGLKTASALTEGVAIENKSAVKSTIQVTAPSGKDSQFFKVKFGE